MYMKIKMLIAPLLIVFAIWMSIWVLVPGYYDLQGKRQELREAQGKLLDVQEKNKRVAGLMEDLNKRTDEQNILFRYLPSERKEEEIIDNLNYLASHEGLSVIEISMVKKEGATAVQASAPEINAPFVSGGNNAGSTSPPSGGSGSAADQAARVVATPVNLDTNFVVMGTYDKIKIFAQKLASLKRFNMIQSMDISRDELEEESEKPSDILKAEMKLSFNYLSRMKASSNINNAIFYKEKFDISAVESIKNKMNTDMVDLKVDLKSRSNPFMPVQ